MSAEVAAVIAGVVVVLVAGPILVVAVLSRDRGRHRSDDGDDE